MRTGSILSLDGDEQTIAHESDRAQWQCNLVLLIPPVSNSHTMTDGLLGHHCIVAFRTLGCSCLESLSPLLPLAIISMASSTAAKKLKTKDGSKQKRFLNLFKRLKPGNVSATQPNSLMVSIASASSDHDPVPGNDAGNAEPTAESGKHGSAILVSSTMIQPLVNLSSWKQCLASGYVLS